MYVCVYIYMYIYIYIYIGVCVCVYIYIYIYIHLIYIAYLVAQMLKNLPAVDLGSFIRHLGQEDLLEKEMATHSSILSWRIPWTEEPGWGHRVGYN